MPDDDAKAIHKRLMATFEHAGAIWPPTAIDVEHGDGGSATLWAKTAGEGWYNIVASARAGAHHRQGARGNQVNSRRPAVNGQED